MIELAPKCSDERAPIFEPRCRCYWRWRRGGTQIPCKLKRGHDGAHFARRMKLGRLIELRWWKP